MLCLEHVNGGFKAPFSIIFATRSTEDNKDSDQPNKQTHDHNSSKNNPWNIAIMVMIITVIDSNRIDKY